MTDRDQRIMEHKARLRVLIALLHQCETAVEEEQRILEVVYGVDLKREGLG